MIKYHESTPKQVKQFLKKIEDRTRSNNKKTQKYSIQEHKSNL